MKHICVTHIDAGTGVVCTAAPMRTGPAFPAGFAYIWGNQSTWPVACNPDGSYAVAPKYYGTCADDADTAIAGVLEVMTEADWNAAKEAEHLARKPYPSWIGYLDTMSWAAPVARPADAIMNGGNTRYQWDEATVNWIPAETQA